MIVTQVTQGRVAVPTMVELRTVVRVAALGSMTKAAQELHYSVSTVSTQIASVSRKLQVPLFERTGSGVVPTRAGKQVIELACPVVCAMQALIAEWDPEQASTCPGDGRSSSHKPGECPGLAHVPGPARPSRCRQDQPPDGRAPVDGSARVPVRSVSTNRAGAMSRRQTATPRT